MAQRLSKLAYWIQIKMKNLRLNRLIFILILLFGFFAAGQAGAHDINFGASPNPTDGPFRLFWNDPQDKIDRCRLWYQDGGGSWRVLSNGFIDGSSGEYSHTLNWASENYQLECQDRVNGWADHWDIKNLTVYRKISMDLGVNNNYGGSYTINPGEYFKLTWWSNFADNCSIVSPQNTGQVGSSGEYWLYPGSSMYPPSGESQTYSATCWNSSGVQSYVTDSVTVYQQKPQPPSCNIDANKTQAYPDESITLNWSSERADSCSSNFINPISLNGSASSIPSNAGSGYTYGFYCSNAGGSCSDTVAVSVVSPPQCQFNSGYPKANPSSIPYNTSTNIYWDNTQCSSATISGGRFGGGSSENSGVSTGNLKETTSYNIRLCNQYNCTDGSVAVKVASQPQPVSVSLSSDKNQVYSDEQVTLTWSSSNADSCSSNFINPLPLRGSTNSTPSHAGANGYTYKATCDGPGGSDSDEVRVNVVQRPQSSPTVSISASPSSIYKGESSILNWSSTNAASCSASNGWSGGKSTSGSETVSPQSTTSYNITCSGSGGSANAQAQISVSERPVASTLSVSSNLRTTWVITAVRLNGQSAPTVRGSGTSGSYNIEPSDGTIYSISAEDIDGYNLSISNSQGSGSSFSLFNSQSGSFTLSYKTVPPAFNYSLSNSGNSSVTKSSSDVYVQNTIGKNLVNGNSQNVNLNLNGVPSGVSYSISNDPCSPTCSSVITFTVRPSAGTGTYAITVSSNPGGKQTIFDLIILGSSEDDNEEDNQDADSPLNVSCQVSSAIAKVGEPVIWTAVVRGGRPPFQYSWTGSGIPSPSPSINPYTVVYSTVGRKSATVRVTDANARSATCNAAAIQITLNPRFEEF